MDKITIGLKGSSLLILLLVCDLLAIPNQLYVLEYQQTDVTFKMMTYGCLMITFLPSMGQVTDWQKGATINQLIRFKNKHILVIKTLIWNLFLTLGYVIFLVFISAFLSGKLLSFEQGTLLILTYAFYMILAMNIELLFGVGMSVLALSFLILLMLFFDDFWILGSLVNIDKLLLANSVCLVIGVIVEVILLILMFNRKEFYGDNV